MNLLLTRRSFLHGLAIWILLFLVHMILRTFGLSLESQMGALILSVVAAYAAWVATSRLHVVSISQGVFLGALWVLTSMLFDGLVQGMWLQEGWTTILASWTTWVRYIVLLLIPVVASSRRNLPRS